MEYISLKDIAYVFVIDIFILQKLFTKDFAGQKGTTFELPSMSEGL
jgi:hypothetical protein